MELDQAKFFNLVLEKTNAKLNNANNQITVLECQLQMVAERNQELEQIIAKLNKEVENLKTKKGKKQEEDSAEFKY